jgi:hypothetical protein
MTHKKASDEFAFIRDKLRKTASLLVTGEKSDMIEAAFLIGCLHSICCEDAIHFEEPKIDIAQKHSLS